MYLYVLVFLVMLIIIKQTEQNPNLSESGATTTSSVSSNTKNNHIKGNYKTPKKKNFQIPVKKNVKTVSPDFPNKNSKVIINLE